MFTFNIVLMNVDKSMVNYRNEVIRQSLLTCFLFTPIYVHSKLHAHSLFNGWWFKLVSDTLIVSTEAG